MGLFGPPNVEEMQAKGDVKGLIKGLGYWNDDVSMFLGGNLRWYAARVGVYAGRLQVRWSKLAVPAPPSRSSPRSRIAAAKCVCWRQAALGQIGEATLAPSSRSTPRSTT